MILCIVIDKIGVFILKKHINYEIMINILTTGLAVCVSHRMSDHKTNIKFKKLYFI